MTVGDYVTLQRGITYKGNLVGKPGPALLGLGSIVPGGGFREGDYKTYGGDCPAKLMLYPGDLFASLKGATKDGKMIGSVARVPDSVSSGRLTQDTVKLEFNKRDKELSDYLYWVLRTPQYRDYCDRHATGSAVVALSREDFLNYPVPPINATRKGIVALLEAIEYKIELNRQMNVTLEAMAQALFKSWFVDFDPVIDNALAAGNPIPNELQARAEVRAALGDRRKPLPEAIKKQFPSSFVFSEEMGWVPEGWEVCRVGQVLELAYGKSLTANYRAKGKIPVFGSGGLSGYHNEKFVNGPGIVVGRKGTVGSLYWVEVDFFPIDTVFYVVNKSHAPLYWLYQNLGVIDIKSMGADSAVPGVNRNAVYAAHICMPNYDVFEGYLRQINFFNTKRKEILEHNNILSDLRDTLLPKLLSGELRIPEAEKRVAEAV